MTHDAAITDADLSERIRERLEFRQVLVTKPRRSDYDLNPQWGRSSPTGRELKPAAVLIPITYDKLNGLRVIFTRRADHLPQHPGQVSFPGGRITKNDIDAYAAALRETEEETGIAPSFVKLRGRLDTYETGTGFAIQPFIGSLREGFTLKMDPTEVAEIFQVPLRFLMDPKNHERHSRTWEGRERHFYAMTFDQHYIWGATAGILMNLHERLFGELGNG
jgi:8-oxo-dGTP pyrophosphatase MutT (NUDIX family)